MKVDILVIKTQNELEWLYERLKKNNPISCDVETNWFDWRRTKLLSIGFSWKKGTGVSVPLFHKEAKISADINKLRDILENKKLIFHNAKFDAVQLWINGIFVTPYYDTMLAHYIAVDERRGTHSLKYLSKTILNYEYKDVHDLMTSRKKTFESVPLDYLLKYNANDAIVTFMLYEEFKDKTPKIFYDLLMPATTTLAKMELRGVKIDRDYLIRLKEGLIEYVNKTESKIKSEFSFNPDSPKQVVEYFRRKGVKMESADKWELYRISKKSDVARLILDYRKARKLISTYTDTLLKKLDENKYLHTDYMLHGTVTGRLASKNPNLQNIPRESKTKKMFVPSERFVFVEADYSQIEMRIAAILSNEERLLKAFRENRDIHDETAKTIFKTEKFSKEQRVAAKMLNFGIVYGRGEGSIAYGLNISIDEARKLLNNFYSAFPKLRTYMKACEGLARKNGYLRSKSGRIRRFIFESDVMATKAVNFPIQSLASDITLKTLTIIDKLFNKLGLISRPVLIVHDSILFEVPETELAFVTRLIRRVAKKVPFKYLPESTIEFPVNVSTGNSWGNLESYVFFKSHVDDKQLKLIDDALTFGEM